MQKARKMLLYLIVIVMDFYLLPLIIMDTGMAMVTLLVLVPLICFICSVSYGINHSFDLLYPVIVAVIFMPSIFIYYNSSAWVYIIGYGIVALAGDAVGSIFFKQRK